MNTLKAIRGRRSIRKYAEKVISKEILYQLLEAAMYAPSARNEQPWHFIIIDERKILDRIPSVHPYAEMLREAPLAILICGDKNIEKSIEYIAIDCAAATQNMLLAAYELGLGSCWLGVYPRESRVKGLSELLAIPHNIVPISLVAIGYPAETKETPERFINERVHLNGW